MTSLFITLSLFVHGLDQVEPGRTVMVRKTDVSAVYPSNCNTWSSGTGWGGKNYGYAPCVVVLLKNKEQLEVQESVNNIMTLLGEKNVK